MNSDKLGNVKQTNLGRVTELVVSHPKGAVRGAQSRRRPPHHRGSDEDTVTTSRSRMGESAGRPIGSESFLATLETQPSAAYVRLSADRSQPVTEQHGALSAPSPYPPATISVANSIGCELSIVTRDNELAQTCLRRVR
jgi:hypothetical protein